MAERVDLSKEPCSLTFLLGVAASQAKLAARRQCLENPLTLTSDQALVVRTLREENGLSQGDLARRTGKDAPSLSRILALMGKKGLVEKRRDERDRRVWRVFVTEEVERFSFELCCDLDETEKRLLKGISEEEVRALRVMLWKIVGNCESEFGLESPVPEGWAGGCECAD